MKPKEFSDTDAELARCIKSRMRKEVEAFGLPKYQVAAKAAIREFMTELTQEIINEEF